MKAVVLAAGEGSRLRPLTEETPKPLIAINGTPLLSYVFETLVDLALTEIVVVVGYRSDDIIRYYGDAFRGVPLRFSEQSAMDGLAHAVLAAEPHVDDDFIVTFGDVVFGTSLQPCVDHHQAMSPAATLLTKDVSKGEAERSGVVETDENGTIERVVEKPHESTSTLALPGFFVFAPTIFDACANVQPSERGEYELLDAIEGLREAGHSIALYEASGWHINVNTPTDLRQAAERLNSPNRD